VEAAELIAAIVAEPEQEAPWLVYADWLLDHGDIRGELIRLTDLAASGDQDARRRIQLIELDEERLLSERLLARTKHWQFGWQRGFIRSAELLRDIGQPFDAEVLAALCADPHAALIAKLDLDFFEHAIRFPSGTFDNQFRRDIRYAGDVSAALSKLPHLDRLVLHGLSSSAFTHDHLRVVETDQHACDGAITGEWDLPALEELVWELDPEDDVVFSEPNSFLGRPPPRLRAMSLKNIEPRRVQMLAELGCLRQLESLTLTVTTLEALAVVRDRAPVFASLSELSFPFLSRSDDVDNTRALRHELERALPNTKLVVDWDYVLRQEEHPPEPVEQPVVVVDANSRDQNGQINAMAGWMQGGRKRGV
jgi:uncharacterized protein (TIGR02996 family)